MGGAAVVVLCDAVGVVVVVAIAGVMSGLTLGLLSMDRLDLELMLRTGSKQQERLARRCAYKPKPEQQQQRRDRKRVVSAYGSPLRQLLRVACCAAGLVRGKQNPGSRVCCTNSSSNQLIIFFTLRAVVCQPFGAGKALKLSATAHTVLG